MAVPQDETSMFQVSQNIVVGQERSDEQKATTTPAMYGTSKFGGGAKVTKIKLNSAGDIYFFIAAIKTDVGAFVFFCLIFTILLRSCPEVMGFRAVCGFNPEIEGQSASDEWKTSEWTEEEIQAMPNWGDGFDENGDEVMLEPATLFQKKNNFPAPKAARFDPEDLRWNKKEGWTAWWNASFGLDLWSDSVIQAIGLDAAMLLIFTELAMKIMIVAGGPMLLIGAPIYIFLGGGAAKKDVLSWQGVGNVWYDGNAETLHEKNLIDDIQYIWFILAFATMYVTVVVMNELCAFQERFIGKRKRWLRGMPPPQSRTILVELLPVPPPPLDKKALGGEGESDRVAWDDEYLKAYFEKMFPGQIEDAYVIRKASHLIDQIDAYSDLAGGMTPEQKSAEDVLTMLDDIADIQEDINDRKLTRPQDYYSCNGFITFKETEHRDAALFQRISDYNSEFEMSNPPLPNDIIFADLETDAEDRFINDRAGDLCIVLLFFSFMPIILMIAKFSSLSAIEADSPAIKKFLRANKLEATVGGVLASLGLTIMMSMLPTFLMMIFEFYCLKSMAWKQLELQKWYFWFLVVFVLLVTCVGSDLTGTLECIAQRPFSIFSLLANRMPLTTHFYLNYCIMQPLTHGMNLTRYINLMKYWLFKKMYARPGGGRCEAARFKSEPEDQDYYGIGSRSARFAFMLLIGIVLGTICPLMNAVVFFNFFCCRLVYGYLMTCAESRKNDAGGEAWVLQLHHLSQAFPIYIALQVGIISHRAESGLPATLAAISFFIWLKGFNRLRQRRWYQLSLIDVMCPDEKEGYVRLRTSLLPKYSQCLDEVYMVPYGKEGKGEQIWLDHYKSLP